MNKPKIIFIINAIQQQRCIKRINEFLDNGYAVDVYGFSRSAIIPTQPERFRIQILDTFDNTVSYAERMKRMLHVLRPVFAKYRGEQVIYYYFLLDVAIAGRLLSRNRYIYEESDLMQTWIGNRLLCSILNEIDRWMIRHSLLTVQTSEGFGKYHFGDKIPSNLISIPNKLNPDILQYPVESHPVDSHHLRFAFVGGVRYLSTIRFAQTVAQKFPQHSFHFYGTIQQYGDEVTELCDHYSNIVYHGPFSNPKDLPSIYKQIDVLVSTYDITIENVRYAEPNKLYEACYFETPIVVTSGTFLNQSVDKLGIGYAIDGLKKEDISQFIESLSEKSLIEKQNNSHKIPKEQLINHNPLFFEKLKQLIQ